MFDFIFSALNTWRAAFRDAARCLLTQHDAVLEAHNLCDVEQIAN
jgi:hypothetical protein